MMIGVNVVVMIGIPPKIAYTFYHFKWFGHWSNVTPAYIIWVGQTSLFRLCKIYKPQYHYFPCCSHLAVSSINYYFLFYYLQRMSWFPSITTRLHDLFLSNFLCWMGMIWKGAFPSMDRFSRFAINHWVFFHWLRYRWYTLYVFMFDGNFKT